MARIRIDDLPPDAALTPEELEVIEGAGRPALGLERLEDREMCAADIGRALSTGVMPRWDPAAGDALVRTVSTSNEIYVGEGGGHAAAKPIMGLAAAAPGLDSVPWGRGTLTADSSYGGGLSASQTGDMNPVQAFEFGKDNLVGGDGNDTLYGDISTFELTADSSDGGGLPASQTRDMNAFELGKNTLVGGDGNDTLYGDISTFELTAYGGGLHASQTRDMNPVDGAGDLLHTNAQFEGAGGGFAVQGGPSREWDEGGRHHKETILANGDKVDEQSWGGNHHFVTVTRPGKGNLVTAEDNGDGRGFVVTTTNPGVGQTKTTFDRYGGMWNGAAWVPEAGQRLLSTDRTLDDGAKFHGESKGGQWVETITGSKAFQARTAVFDKEGGNLLSRETTANDGAKVHGEAKGGRWVETTTGSKAFQTRTAVFDKEGGKLLSQVTAQNDGSRVEVNNSSAEFQTRTEVFDNTGMVVSRETTANDGVTVHGELKGGRWVETTTGSKAFQTRTAVFDKEGGKLLSRETTANDGSKIHGEWNEGKWVETITGSAEFVKRIEVYDGEGRTTLLERTTSLKTTWNSDTASVNEKLQENGTWKVTTIGKGKAAGESFRAFKTETKVFANMGGKLVSYEKTWADGETHQQHSKGDRWVDTTQEASGRIVTTVWTKQEHSGGFGSADHLYMVETNGDRTTVTFYHQKGLTVAWGATRMGSENATATWEYKQGRLVSYRANDTGSLGYQWTAAWEDGKGWDKSYVMGSDRPPDCPSHDD